MKTFIVYILLSLCTTAYTQSISTQLIKTQEIEADIFIGVDDYNSLYYISNNIVYKQQNNTTFEYTDFALGTLNNVDILNPLKIVLFYQDTNTIVILDNTLSEIRRINFNTLDTFRTLKHATTANDSSLWIFNIDSQELEVFDYTRNRILAASLPISEDIINQKSNFNFSWLQTKNRLSKYNIYGSLMQDILVENIITFAQNKGNIVLSTQDGLVFVKNNSEVKQDIILTKIDIKQLYLDIENLYIYDGKKLYQYQLNLPKK